MQKKWLIGLVAAGSLMGLGFMACGSGTIESPDDMDETMIQTYLEGHAKEIAEEALDAYNECGELCATPSSESKPAPEPVSSAAPSSSTSGGIIGSSSSIGGVIVSSSSAVVIPTPTSSSSQVVVSDGTVTGSCAPNPAVIDKGGSTNWTFTAASAPPGVGTIAWVNQVNAAICQWAMPGSAEEGESKTCATKTAKATYAASGKFPATLEVDGNTLQCAPVQVNGAKIAGCKCTPDKTSPDVADGSQTVTWTVTGCVTDATITGYQWTGATGTSEKATAVVSEKGDEVTPSVVVSNDDNTEQEFACTSTKAINSGLPDYVLDGTSEGEYTVQPGTYQMLYACSNANQYYQPPVSVSASDGWDPFTVEYSGPDGKKVTLSPNQQHTIAFSALFGTWDSIKAEERFFTVTVDHAAKIKCQ